jgi:hypothetical protein
VVPVVSRPRSYAVFDVPDGLVELDESRFPNLDQSYRLSDLVAFHRLVDGIPPVHTVLEGARALVVGAHRYAEVSRILGRDRMRIIVRGPLDPEALAAFAAQPGVDEVDVAELLRREAAEPVIDQWHLVCFGQSLSAAQQEQIRLRIVAAVGAGDRAPRPGTEEAGLFELDKLGFDPSRPSVRFVVRVLAEDQSWYGSMLAFLRKLGAEVAHVDTHQGCVLPE